MNFQSSRHQRDRYGKGTTRSGEVYTFFRDSRAWRRGPSARDRDVPITYPDSYFVRSFFKDVVTRRNTRRSDALSLVPSLQQIEELSTLEPNWDGEGASQISALAVAKSTRLAVQAKEQIKVLPSFVSPIPDGGLQVEWQTGTSRLELMVAPDGELAGLLVNTAKHLPRNTVEEHNISDDRVMALLEEMYSRWTGQWR